MNILELEIQTTVLLNLFKKLYVTIMYELCMIEVNLFEEIIITGSSACY